jgi:hypothetical protein
MLFHEHNEIIMCLEGFNDGSLLTVEEAMQCLLKQLYAEQTEPPETWEKRDRNAEIMRRYLAGEDSMVLAHAYGLSDRRVRTIIEHERKRGKEQ